ncbi:unnamed protein product [Closterium sp. NIES-53]
MPMPSSGSEGSPSAGDWGFSGPVKGFPSAQTAPLSALDVAAPAEQSPAQGEQWEALYASVQDALLMYNAQFVSALADGFPPAADVIESLDEALQDLAKDVYVAMDKMEEGVSQRASLFPIRVFAMCASLEVSRCRRLFPKLQEEEEGQQQQKSDHCVAGEVSGEGVSKDAPGVSTEVSGELPGWSFLAAAGNLRDQPVSAALPPLDEDDLTVLEQLLEEAGDEIQGLFLNCKGSLYGLGVTHARSLARFSILGKALKAAIAGATEASFTVLRDGREEVRYLERREAGEKEGGEGKEEGEGRGVGARGRGSGFEFDTSKVVTGCSQMGDSSSKNEGGGEGKEVKERGKEEGEKEEGEEKEEEEEEEEDDDDDYDSDTNESDNIEDDCIIWDDGLQDLRALFPPKQSFMTPSGKSPSGTSASSAAAAASLTPQSRPDAANSIFSDQKQQQKQQHLRTQSEVTLDSSQKSPRAANSIFSDRQQQQNHQRAFSVAVTPNSDSNNLTADSKVGTPTTVAATTLAAPAAETPKGPRLGARIILERIRDYQWLAEWLEIDPDELLIHKVLSVVPVGMLLTDLGVPRSLESSLIESQRPLLLRVVLPGFREEVKRRLLGAGLGWTEGMLVKTVVFEPKRNAAVFTTGGGSAAASGGAAGAAADAASAGGGGGEAGATTGAAAASAAAAGKALAKKPSHNRTKSAEDMQELSPFVSHAVQESLTAGGGLAKQIPLEDILAATDSWSPERKLGEGAYGTVFKGVVGTEGGELWAVKRAGNVSGSHLEEFEKEVSFMSRMAHQHLVRLIGFWADCDERILIYEFMHNGTLASRIHRSVVPASPTGEAPKKAPPPPLTFDERVAISVGAAEGLRYLHDFARPPVIHRDIKSENILLAADLQAKVADFGLLKTSDQGGPGRHVARTRLMGTPGYCDPEYSRTYIATPKSDVYSFGVVLLELVTGRRAILAEPSQKTGMNLGNVASLLQRSKRNAKASAMEPGATTTLVQWAIPLITSGKLKSVVDPALENNYPPGGMKAFANVAVMCVQKSAAQRPTMAEVATRLSVIQQKVQDLHIQGEEPKYNFQPTIGTGAPAGAAAAAAAPIPRAQSAPRPKSPAPKVPQKKAGEKSGSGAGAKAKAKDAGVGEGKEVKGNKVGGKGVMRAKSATQPYLGAKDAVEFSSQHVTAAMTRDTPFYYVWPATEPLVQNFEWKVDETPVSNLVLMLCTCIGYVTFILGLKWYRTKNKMAPVNLGFLPAIHNLILCLWSLAMFLGTIHAMLLDSEINKYDTGMGNYTWLLCFPSTVKPVGYLWFWSYIYYLSKYYELLDTVILVLKNKPLSFLHVYHHATIVFLCWLWLTNTQSLQVIAITINTGIHVMMYFYYFMHSVGMPPPWKMFVTNSQIIQFMIGTFVSFPLIYFHFTRPTGCAGFESFCFNLFFNSSLLYLFVDFHIRNYGKAAKAAKGGKRAKRD